MSAQKVTLASMDAWHERMRAVRRLMWLVAVLGIMFLYWVLEDHFNGRR
jgi:heme/copper-type cytochrome/quinol oxidase subunit 3